MTPGCAPTDLLADHAAGTLSPGMTLIVASHVAICRCCRDKTRRLEALGGALLAEAPPVAPSPRCLDGALARIGRPAAPEPLPRNPGLPRPLCQRLTEPIRDLDWRPLEAGVEACRLDGFAPDRVRLVRARPGARLPRDACAGTEATLVLDGCLRARDLTLARGALALACPLRPHALVPCEVPGPGPCLCLVVVENGAARAPA